MHHKIVIILLMVTSTSFASDEGVMSLSDALKIVAVRSPKLKSVRFHQQALKDEVVDQKGAYLPQIDASAIVSTGDPGSFALLGVDSNISAPQRVGGGAALILRQTIWDFGRTASSVAVAEAREKLEGQSAEVSKNEVQRQLLQTYLTCSFLKSQAKAASFVDQQASMIAKEVGRFVSSGQRSIVERYLVDAKVQEAQTQMAEYSARTLIAEKSLGIELSLGPGESVHCATLDAVTSDVSSLKAAGQESPLFEAERLRVSVAQSLLDRAKADSRPTLMALATGGYFQNDHLSDKLNYAAGVGITLPLFSGFSISSRVDRETADLDAAHARLTEADQAVARANSQYDEQISGLKVRIAYLEKEKEVAHKTLDLAHGRYKRAEGSMVDLRESIQNLTRVLDAMNQAYRDLYLSQGEKALFNGALVQ